MRGAAALPNVTSVTILQNRSKRSDGNLAASCYIHGPDIPENTGFSDYALPFREVNQCTTSFGPVRINSQSTAHFSTAPIRFPCDLCPCLELTVKQIKPRAGHGN